MNRTMIAILAGAVSALAPGVAAAQCKIDRSGQVDVITNAFPVMDHLAKAMNACGSDKLKINVKITDKSRQEIEQAFEAGTSPFEFAHVSNGVFVNLHAKGQIQPITDLVKKYKDRYKLEDLMLVTIGGEVYGIAFMANAQHLFYRKDLLEKAGIQPPKTWDDVLAAAEKLKAAGLSTPYSAAYKVGFDVATEFTNIYLGMGGEFFAPGSAKAAFDNEKAARTLELMGKLKGYMSPNALALATGDVTTAFQQGQAALGNLWASRAAAMDDDKVSKVVNQVAFAAAPAMTRGGKPSNAIWWDAFVMPKNMDGDREAAFLVMMEAVSEDTMKSGMGLANWIRSGFQPGKHAVGVAESLKGGAAMWPDEPYFSLAHAAMGKHVADYLSGKKTAKETLADAVKEYEQAAKEKGFIK